MKNLSAHQQYSYTEYAKLLDIAERIRKQNGFPVGSKTGSNNHMCYPTKSMQHPENANLGLNTIIFSKKNLNDQLLERRIEAAKVLNDLFK
jgi:hypothetical protein